MRIAATQYNLAHKALEIYVSGCLAPHCVGCHNRELWDFSAGRSLHEAKASIIDKFVTGYSMINSVWVLGGEPLDQPEEELTDLLTIFPVGMPVVLFTRRELSEVPARILGRVDAVKTGAYREDLASSDYEHRAIKLGSTNQRINLRGHDF